MIKKDFHVHTTFCDGKNTPEEMVLKAISLSFEKLGLVCHAYTPFDESWCIKKQNINEFKIEINRLKGKYKDKISIYLGAEYDYYSQLDTTGFDFIIGAVHYVLKNGMYIPVDENKQSLMKNVSKYYGGDFYSFASDYFTTLGDIYSKTTPNFIAHFDLVTKFNKDGDLFDEKEERYISAWKACADKLLSKNSVFEINLGGIIRGYKDAPYPSKEQIKYLSERGARFIVNSDSHRANTLGFDYQKYLSQEIQLFNLKRKRLC